MIGMTTASSDGKSRKILHIITSMNPELGGVCKAVRMIINGLTEHEVCNEVVSLDSPDSEYTMTDSFKVYALGPATGKWCYSSKLIPWLIKNYSRYDSIIIHGLWLYIGYATEKALRIIKKKNELELNSNVICPKVFVMPHGMLDPYFQKAENRKLKALRNVIYWKLIENKVIKNSYGILFTCEEEKRLAKFTFQSYFPRNEFIAGLGVEEPPPYTAEMKLAFLKKIPEFEGEPYILFLSRIHEKKGVDLLVNAYAELYSKLALKKKSLKEQASFSQVVELPKLIIAGPNLEFTYGRKIQNLVSQNVNIKHKIYFTGMLVGDAKWGALYGCEAFILPSHQDNFGIAIVEALSCKKPVLISNRINIWKEIEAEGGGIIEENTLTGTIKLLENWIYYSRAEKQKFNYSARNSYEKYFSVSRASACFFTAIYS